MGKSWKVAAVQTDVRLGNVAANLANMEEKIRQAAGQGAQLIVLPECALTGYGFPNRSAAQEVAQPVPGPATDAVSKLCHDLNIWAVFGLIEQDGEKLYNSCPLIGPNGLQAVYRKIHLPCVGADRFLDPGDKPFAVHDIGGLKVGINICFDGSFPESSRIMTLLGADLILLPTNWADNAIRMATLVPKVRAFENHIYYMAVNRVGNEAGYHYVGHSSISNCVGDYLDSADHDGEAILLADVDPEVARSKKTVHCLGEYEIDRVNWRRPELYGMLVEPSEQPFRGHRIF